MRKPYSFEMLLRATLRAAGEKGQLSQTRAGVVALLGQNAAIHGALMKALLASNPVANPEATVYYLLEANEKLQEVGSGSGSKR